MLTKEQKERFERNGYTCPKEKEVIIKNDSEPYFATRLIVFVIVAVFCVDIIQLLSKMSLFLTGVAILTMTIWLPLTIYTILIKRRNKS